ncbi:MAG TPA: CoA pyrophosphatase [Thermoanaerobaculia bacterium]|nr:CoA pyrophosphatase [Thermoanaerobaculia bacterium]
MFDDRSLEELRRLMKARPALEIVAPQYRRAAVLIPLIRDGNHWSVLFTRRAENMASHSGQISFPGGAVEPDEPLDQAAIREAEEEVGIRPGDVELIGRLDDLVTNSGYLVAPFAGIVHKPAQYIIQEAEVVEAFEVPIDALLDPAKPEVRYVSFRNRQYPAYYYVHEQYEIWGLTGRMLKSFLDLVWQAV